MEPELFDPIFAPELAPVPTDQPTPTFRPMNSYLTYLSMKTGDTREEKLKAFKMTIYMQDTGYIQIVYFLENFVFF